VRTAEALEACGRLGVRGDVWDFPHEGIDVTAANIARVVDYFTAENPDVVIAHWPVDTHPDHRSVGILALPKVDAFHLGEVFYFFEVMTGRAGQLYQVNAFDQPGVEHGKNAAYALLGRNGYEDLRKEIETDLQRREERYILA